MKKRYIAVPVCIAAVAFTVYGDLSRKESNEKFPERKSEAIDGLQFITQAAAWPGVDIPPDAYQKAWEHYRTHFVSNARSMATGQWQSIGPNNVGGRTLCIAINPTDTATVWLGAASGGLWKSTTGGIGVNAWTYVPTGFPVLGVSSIAIDPQNDNVMYIGTGETYNYGTNTNGLADRTTRGTHGMGILKSTDGGATWNYSLNWSYQQQRGIWEIIINPLNPSTVFAATTEGIYRSYDAGASWSQVLNTTMCMDMAMHKTDTTVLLCGAGNFNSPNKGLYRSADGGDTWNVVTNGLPPNTQTGRITIALYESNNNYGVVQICDMFNTIGFYKTSDKGVTWSALSNQDIGGYQGWYAKGMLIDPQDSLLLLAGGIQMNRSVDGGQSFVQTSNISWNTDYMHPDVHDIVVNPLDPNKVYIATDGGLARTNDYGDSFFECTDGYVTSQHYIGSISQLNPNLGLSGLQDNYTQQYTGTNYWYPVIGGDGCYNAINPDDDTYQFGAYQYLNVIASYDGGASFSNQVIYSASSANGSNPAAFLAPYIIAPSNTQYMYAGGDSLIVSNDGGNSWNSIGPTPLNNGNYISTIAVSHMNKDSVYVATAPGTGGPAQVYRSINGGSTVTNITGTLPDRYPRRIAVNPRNSREVYIAYSGFGTGHIFKSTNAGTSWTDISGTLPDVPFHCVLVDPINSNMIYAGSDLGLFISHDAGASWNAYNTGLPDMTMVFDIVYSDIDISMLLFTHGHGVFKRSRSELLSSPEITANENGFLVYPNPASDKTFLRWNASDADEMLIRVYDISGKIIFSKTQASVRGENIFAIETASWNDGAYIISAECGKERYTKRMLVVH